MALKTYRNYKRVLFGFTVKKNIKQAIVIGMFSAFLISASAIGFYNAYPTVAERMTVAATFSSNTGLVAMLGKPLNLWTVEGFTTWRSLGTLQLIVSIWALFLSTRLFRGDEEHGRLELMLTGHSSLVNATKQLLFAIVALLLPVAVIVSGALAATSAAKSFDWQPSAVAFFGFVVVLNALLFASIGALISQISATRAAALKIGAATFGAIFMLRALGDISAGVSWLSALSPLGWLERLHPLVATDTVWLIPLVIVIVGCSALALAIAWRRDYGASILPDTDTARPRYRWLGGHGNGLLYRLHRTNAFLWVIGMTAINFMFGTFLESATEALNQSNGLQGGLNQITSSSATNPTYLFVSVIFMMMTLLLLIMVTGQANSFREEEARGYMDNLLVRQANRLGLSATKLFLIIGSVAVTISGIVFGMYLGAHSQGLVLDKSDMVLAGINLLAVPLLLLGMAFLLFGFVPRLMSVLLYSLVGWSFVVEIVGSVIKLNHWILDLSLLHHIPLAPAMAVNWHVFTVYILLAVCMTVLGVWRFTKRDIELW